MGWKKNYKKGTDYNILYGRQDSDYYMSSGEKKRLEKNEQYFLNEEGAKEAFLKLNIYMKLLELEKEAKEPKSIDSTKNKKPKNIFRPKNPHQQPAISYEEMANMPLSNPINKNNKKNSR